ncbi:hypothetical protein GA0115255_107302 [Streptomyces sp. Ncost-T6T-2b]|nr:hypothetical protein GA0115255_107302 [Streptomyces sp. Ncost-T6T-2b]
MPDAPGGSRPGPASADRTRTRRNSWTEPRGTRAATPGNHRAHGRNGPTPPHRRGRRPARLRALRHLPRQRPGDGGPRRAARRRTAHQRRRPGRVRACHDVRADQVLPAVLVPLRLQLHPPRWTPPNATAPPSRRGCCAVCSPCSCWGSCTRRCCTPATSSPRTPSSAWSCSPRAPPTRAGCGGPRSGCTESWPRSTSSSGRSSPWWTPVTTARHPPRSPSRPPRTGAARAT